MPAPISQRAPMRSENLSGDRSDEDDQHRHRQERRTGLDRAVAEDALQEQRVVEEDAEHREPDEQHRGVRAGERRILEQREVEHRQALVQLEQHEGHQDDRCDREQAPARASSVQA